MSGERLVWYIDTCSISNPDNTQNLTIIEDACYSDIVHGENQNLPYTKILVDDKSKFKYTAFGFEDLNNQNYQMLSCEVLNRFFVEDSKTKHSDSNVYTICRW